MAVIIQADATDPRIPARGVAVVDVSEERRRADLLKVIGRGLNTMSDPPGWILELYGELRSEG